MFSPVCFLNFFMLQCVKSILDLYQETMSNESESIISQILNKGAFGSGYLEFRRETGYVYIGGSGIVGVLCSPRL